MNRFRVFCVFLCFLLVISFTGCGGDGVPFLPGTDGTQSTESQPSATASPQKKNPLTGREDMAGEANDRPVGVMIANNDFIQGEQVGIAGADMWMEAETEGGITRIMAIFSAASRLPASIGPIRSARSPFVHVAEALGLAYVHAGGSAPALQNIASADIGDIDLDTGEGANYSWRDDDYRQTHAYEFCLRTGGEQIGRYLWDHSYSLTATRTVPWSFGTQTGTPAGSVDLSFSNSQRVSFVYDSENGVYDKFNGSQKIRHCDINGTPIQAENVMVLFTDKFWETQETFDFYLQTGTGKLFSGGLTRSFEWTRANGAFLFTEEDGSPLLLSKGRTYLCVVGTEYEGNLTVGSE